MKALKWVEFLLATLPATVFVGVLFMLGSGVLAGLAIAAFAHAAERDRAGLASDLQALTWIGGSMLAAVWGVVALWLATFGRRFLRKSRSLRWFVIFGLLAGLADAIFWLSAQSVRASPLHAYLLVTASLAGLRNLYVLTLRRSEP